MTAPLLVVRDLDVRYGEVPAVRGVGLHVDPGEMVALLGANGAGKTTMLRAISGALRPSGGEIVFDGERIDGLSAHRVVAHGLSHLPEGRDLFPQLSVRENLQLGFWPRRSRRSEIGAALERVFDVFPVLRERVGQAAGTLSGGEQQMLGIARSLMAEPRMLIVDELSLGLAPKIVDQLFDVLAAVNRSGTALLIVEQFVDMALAHTHRAYVLAKGEVVLEGDSAELLGREDLVASYLGGELARGPGTNGAGRAARTGRRGTERR